MQHESELDLANREFEQISPTRASAYDEMLRRAFQVRPLAPGLPNIGQRAYTAPGSMPYQTGPSPVSALLVSPSSQGGEGNPMQVNIFNPLLISGPVHPDSDPPVGPEERIRYSCVSGKCLQDPNGVYYGLDECLADECGVGGGVSKGCDCGCGPSQTIIKATITGYIGPSGGYTTGSGRSYWTYTWTEVTTSGSPRSSTTNGLAVNEYEWSVDNNGGNTVPATATLTRKRIPSDIVVPMFLDESCSPWFFADNPLTVTCI